MVYLFAVYFILWALAFGYVFSIGSRQRRLQRELDLLRETNRGGVATQLPGSFSKTAQ